MRLIVVNSPKAATTRVIVSRKGGGAGLKRGRKKCYTPQRLEKEVQKYFDSITREKMVTEKVDSGEKDGYGHAIFVEQPVINKLGQEVTVTEYLVPPTAGDLCAFLGIDSSTWERYGKDEEFCGTVTRARGRMRDWNIRELLTREGKNIAGIKANLELNYGVRVENDDGAGKTVRVLETMDTGEKLKYLNELRVQVTEDGVYGA